MSEVKVMFNTLEDIRNTCVLWIALMVIWIFSMKARLLTESPCSGY